MKKVIIGMIGKAGSGKDTVGNYICNMFDFQSMALADPLKASIKEMFLLDEKSVYDRVEREKPLEVFPQWTVRKLLQFVGTDLMRKQFDNDFWVKLLNKRIIKSDHPCIVVTDLRFPNETEYLHSLVENNGYSVSFIKVVRDGYIGNDIGIKNHESEQYDLPANYIIENNDTIEVLYGKVDKLVSEIVSNYGGIV